MPYVDFSTEIRVAPKVVWSAMLDIESFPDYMENVERAEIVSLSADGTARVSSWAALLKGSVLEWVEEERIDYGRSVIEFRQVKGDLSVYEGQWSVTEQDGISVVRLAVEFDIGIPLLANMLNPVASRALRENQEQMLSSLERRVTGTPG